MGDVPTLLGLFQQDTYIPLKYCPLTLEIELVNAFTDCVVTRPAGANPGGQDNNPINRQNTSDQWSIEEPQIKCDVVILDNTLDNEYAAHLLSGKALPISFSTYISQVQSIPAGQTDPKLNIARSVTRLKSVFISLFRDLSTRAYIDFHPFETMAGVTTFSKECIFLCIQI